MRNCRPQLQFIKVVHIPVVVQRPISMVLVTIESPQLQFDKVSSSLLCWLCSSTGAGCGGDIPQLHRVRHPRVVMQRQFPLAQLFSRPLRFSSCSSLIWCSTSLLFGSTGQVVSRPDVVDIPIMVQRHVPLVLTAQADHRASPVAVH